MDAPETPPPDGARRGLDAYLGRRIFLARAALIWEQAWPAFWSAVLVAGAFLAIALLDILPRLPAWLHALALAAFATALGAAAWRAARSLRLPDINAARRRVERASGLAHRPLTVVVDHPATGEDDPAARALWQVHRERMLSALRRLRVGWPMAGLARRDPWGLRAVLALALILAAIDAGGDAPRRVAHALEPDVGGLRASPATLSIWIAPPEYTGLAPIVLAPAATTPGAGPLPAADEAIAVPLASTVLAQVNGGRGAPTLRLGEEVAAFTSADGEGYKASAAIEESGRVTVRQGHAVLGEWDIAVIPDAPPAVEFTRPPSATERAVLRLDARARDDYGVVGLSALVRRPGDGAGGDPATDEGFELALPLPGAAPKEADATSYHDLTAHPWAGLEVRLWLEASDAIGQTGVSAAMSVTLPERVFHHPVARAIVAERKRLALDSGARREVARALSEIAEAPARYGDDVVVYLALKMARSRLFLDPDDEAVAEVQALLWDTALRVEDGDLSLAERELREIERALLEALAEGADRAEIERLLDELQAAMERYLNALAQSMEEGTPRPEQPAFMDPSADLVNREDLLGLLERARELARTGDLEAARELLSQLQNVLENMRAARTGGPETNRALKAMEGLRGLIDRQQDLLDRSFQRSRPPPLPLPGRPPPERAPSAQAEAAANARDGAAQEAARRDLGDMMLELGDMLGRIPGPLGRAERAMREAAEALEEGAPREAVKPQTRALDELQQGARAAGEALMQQLRQQAGAGVPSPGPGQGRDPLGRRLPGEGGWQTGTVAIPDEMELRKAREILDELRRRAGEPDRPPLERDYIDRLLPEF